MSAASRHPSRRTMLDAIESGQVPFRDHLKKCPACRKLFELLQRYAQPGRAPMVGSAPETVSRLAAIPMAAGRMRPDGQTAGHLHQDSWTDLPAVALRDSGVGLERRMVLCAGRIRLELLAHRTRSGWEFVARVFDGDQPVTEYALRAGRVTLAPAPDAYYYWRAEHPPKTLRLISSSVRIDFDRLSWFPKKNK